MTDIIEFCVTPQEAAAVLAGLRLYKMHRSHLDADVADLASNHGSYEPLDADQIDELCETIAGSPVSLDDIEPPEYLRCHNPACRRVSLTIDEIPETTYGPDPFWYCEDLDSWICPDCGGTDVY